MTIVVAPTSPLYGHSSDLIELGLGSRLEYNDLFFYNDATRPEKYRVTEIDGLGDPDIRDSREVNPQDHGETAFSAWYGGRTITITGRIEAGNLNVMRKMQLDLKTAFGTFEELPLYFRTNDPLRDVFISCRKSGPLLLREAQTDQWFRRDFQITLRASYPFFKGIYLNSETFDFDTNSLPLRATNNGNFPASPIIRFYGPVNAPSLYNPRNDLTLTMEGPIELDDYLEIDTLNRTVVDSHGDNKFNKLARSSDWPILEWGSNDLIPSAAWYGTEASVQVEWRHTWL